MSKCIKCGGSFLTRFKIKLKDADICRKCALELGFPKDFYLTSSLCSWEDIKDGREEYLKRKYQKDSGFKMAHYGERRGLDCTDEEQEIFDIISENIDRDLQLVRKSQNYVTVLCGEWDLARVKFSDSAKWILFPIVDRSDARIYIESPEDVLKYMDKLRDSLAHIDKYSK